MLLAFFVLLIPASVAQTMQSLSARIVDVTSCDLTELSYEDCSAQCLSIPGCMIAYMENNNGECYLCPYGIITTMALDTSNTANLTIRCDNCTSTSSTYEGHVTTNSVDKYYYYITSSSEGWSITEDNGCLDNTWKRFSRVLGPWCILPYYSSTPYTWDAANSHCATAYNAVLSGLETRNELNFVNESIHARWTTSIGFWWAGAKRRPQCTNTYWDATICNNTALTSFYWTDNFTTGTAGYHWAPTQPNGQISNGEQEGCMVVYETAGPYSLNGWADDLVCSQDGTWNTVLALGHACGMKARH